MRAYVLCGGFGTRLRSVTGDSQKALVPIHGEPFLVHVLRQLVVAGITEAVLCAHYRADQVANQLEDLSRASGLPLRMVVEPEPLGTGGALLNALRESPPENRYLVLNADTFLDPEAYRLAATAAGDVLVAVRVEDRARYGSLETDTQGRLVALREKGQHGPGLVNAGVYAFTPMAFANAEVNVCSMEQDLLPALVLGEGVAVLEYTDRFIDIGTPESFEHYLNNSYGGATQ
ncbi:sugar phosphate nucleotidyltransferase [Stutzerimonas nitrititolerans]|uniref:HAD family hydrolase n=1 Tax=Stutzerimonas nitrititolerans TaxID=2482751 RepID=A0ABX9V3F8_9GAMM|nr:sugar phosphate nucleotidyltransferase [Stutzerimonas nitrititolerans]RMI00200.1 HAD family hydrolase [Stutzerimonas nitrititolerans]